MKYVKIYIGHRNVKTLRSRPAGKRSVKEGRWDSPEDPATGTILRRSQSELRPTGQTPAKPPRGGIAESTGINYIDNRNTRVTEQLAPKKPKKKRGDKRKENLFRITGCGCPARRPGRRRREEDASLCDEFARVSPHRQDTLRDLGMGKR